MERAIDVAAYIIRKYREVSGEEIDEMKLHKLLYFTQREAIAITGEPAISDSFEGWKYGPVCCAVRKLYYNGEINAEIKAIPSALQYIADNVIYEYGSLASWKLSQLSHEEKSWKNARKGLKADDCGSVEMKIDDIYYDAKKIRPYDHVWDMYYDEFEDEAVTV